jgi:hypothetical protein
MRIVCGLALLLFGACLMGDAVMLAASGELAECLAWCSPRQPCSVDVILRVGLGPVALFAGWRLLR